MLLELFPSKLGFPPHSPPLNLTYFPDDVRNANGMLNIQCDFFGIGVTCNDPILLSSLFLSGWVLQVLEREELLLFLFTEKTVKIEPATTLFMVSHPVCDAIVRK